MRVQAPPPIIMEIIEIEQKKMDALRVLSETNLEMSKAKALLLELQKNERAYFNDRENRVSVTIQKLMDDSSDVIRSATATYDEIMALSKEISAFVDILVDANTQFDTIISDFERKKEEWDTEVKEKDKQVEENNRKIESIQTIIKNDKVSISKELKKLEDRVRIVSAREGDVERNHARIMRQEIDVDTKLKLIKAEQKRNDEENNALLAKESVIKNQQDQLDEREKNILRKERALSSKYETLEKTLKEVIHK